MLGRELGVYTIRRETINERPVEGSKKLGFKQSILRTNILVKRKIPLPFYMRQEIENLHLNIVRLRREFKVLSMDRLYDFFILDIDELKACFKRVSQFYGFPVGCCLSKDRIIEGIKMRAREEFSDEPNYEEIQTQKLAEIFSFQQEELTVRINEVLREIDQLEAI